MASKVLRDLSPLKEINQWRSVDDLPVGGRSRSHLSLGDSGGIVFSGTICCDRGSGYASIRSNTHLFDLSEYSGLTLKVKGDARRYKLSLRCATDFDGIAYRVSFQTEQDVEQTIHLRWDVFVPTYNDKILAAPSPLNPSEIRSIGFVVAGNETGTFHLEILGIEATTRHFRKQI